MDYLLEGFKLHATDYWGVTALPVVMAWSQAKRRLGAVKLCDVYREIVLEHSRHPRNKGALVGATIRERGANPSCGDELELQLRVEGDRIVSAHFVGSGCAISQASASLMTLALEGKTRGEALELAEDFHAMLRGAPPSARLGEVAALEGVAKLHARVKCAALPWQTLEAALARSGEKQSAPSQ